MSRRRRHQQRKKKNSFGLPKRTTLHVLHTFSYISLVSPHDYDVKMTNFAFYGGRK